MDGVEFNENQEIRSFNSVNNQTKMSLLTRIVIKLGLAKDQKQANNVMLIISIICLLLMFYFLISTFFPNALNFSKPKQTTTPKTLQERIDATSNGSQSTSNQ